VLGLTCAVFLETLRHPPAAFLTRSASKNMAFGENAIEAVIGRGLASDHTSALELWAAPDYSFQIGYRNIATVKSSRGH